MLMVTAFHCVVPLELIVMLSLCFLTGSVLLRWFPYLCWGIYLRRVCEEECWTSESSYSWFTIRQQGGARTTGDV